MSLTSLRQTLNEEMLRFAWRQWSQLGIAGEVEFRDSWIIDPEALLVLTMSAGRRDPRLFDEVVDWTVRNGRWISLQRLKNIANSADDETRRALAAFAAVVDSHDTKRRWHSISQLYPPGQTQLSPFFTDASGEPFPVIGEVDEHFQERGLARSKVVLRGLSVPVTMAPPANLLFKLRSLFGLAPRAEVMAYLMTHDGGKASVLARSAVYSYPPINEALAELAQSGLVYLQGSGFYSADLERWSSFLETPVPLPVWVEWPRVFAALSEIAGFLTQAAEAPVSDYLVRSRAVTLNDRLRDMLSNSGLPNPFLKPCDLDDSIEAISQRAGDLTAALNAGNSDTRVN